MPEGGIIVLSENDKTEFCLSGVQFEIRVSCENWD